MIYTVPDEAAGERLDAWISGAADISRSRAQKLIEEGGILRNGKPADKKGQGIPRGRDNGYTPGALGM